MTKAHRQVYTIGHQVTQLLAGHQIQLQLLVARHEAAQRRGQDQTREKRIDITRNLPRTALALPEARVAASSSPASKGAISSYRRRPSSVSLTERVVRSNRRIPRRASSRAMARLTPDCVMSSASAALTKLPLSTTADNTPIPLAKRPSKPIDDSWSLAQ